MSELQTTSSWNFFLLGRWERWALERAIWISFNKRHDTLRTNSFLMRHGIICEWIAKMPFSKQKHLFGKETVWLVNISSILDWLCVWLCFVHWNKISLAVFEIMDRKLYCHLLIFNLRIRQLLWAMPIQHWYHSNRASGADGATHTRLKGRQQALMNFLAALLSYNPWQILDGQSAVSAQSQCHQIMKEGIKQAEKRGGEQGGRGRTEKRENNDKGQLGGGGGGG